MGADDRDVTTHDRGVTTDDRDVTTDDRDVTTDERGSKQRSGVMKKRTVSSPWFLKESFLNYMIKYSMSDPEVTKSGRIETFCSLSSTICGHRQASPPFHSISNKVQLHSPKTFYFSHSNLPRCSLL